MSFTVEARDLRKALLAILPHVHKTTTTDTDHRLARVRFTVTSENLLVQATDTRTVALAIVSTWGDDDTDELGQAWDLSADSVRKLLAVHKPARVSGSSGAGFEPEQTILIALEDDQLRTSDISGLLPVGEVLVLPVLSSDEQFPDVAGYLGEAVYTHVGLAPAYDGQPLTTSFAAFDAAVKAYDAPMVVRLAGHGKHRFLVTVGESFIGMVSVQHPAEAATDDQRQIVEAWDAWYRRLPHRMRRADDHDPADFVDLDDEEDDVDDQHNAEPDDPAVGAIRHLASVSSGGA